VLRKSAGLFLLYGVGAVAVPAWSLSHVLAGTVTSENAAAVIVFPFAWIFGYWGVVGPLLAAWKIWKLQSVLEEHCERRAQGLDTDATERDVEDALTLLATQENPIPERWARRLVRLMLRRTPPPAASQGAYPE
jgi:hypothetical protein